MQWVAMRLGRAEALRCKHAHTAQQIAKTTRTTAYRMTSLALPGLYLRLRSSYVLHPARVPWPQVALPLTPCPAAPPMRLPCCPPLCPAVPRTTCAPPTHLQSYANPHHLPAIPLAALPLPPTMAPCLLPCCPAESAVPGADGAPPCAACMCDIGRALVIGLSRSGVNVTELVGGGDQETINSLFTACQ